MDVDELAEELDEEEFAAWCALSVIDDWSGEWQTATICASVFNALLDFQQRLPFIDTIPKEAYRSADDFYMRFKWETAKKESKKPGWSVDKTQAFFKARAGVK